MGRSKKAAATAKTVPDVLRGCLDCVHKDILPTKKPCKDCVRWSLWEISKDAADWRERNQAALEKVKQGHNNAPAKVKRARKARGKTKEGGSTI